MPLVASGDVHMHVRSRRALQDTLTAIRHRASVAEVGDKLFPNGERHLRRREVLAANYPAALMDESLRIAARCTFDLRTINYPYPKELVPDGHTPARGCASSPRTACAGAGRTACRMPSTRRSSANWR